MRRTIIITAVLVILTACASSPPDEPPGIGLPPEVATEGFLVAKTKADIPMSVPRLRAFMEKRPIITFLQPTGNIAVPKETEILAGTWPKAGATRRVTLSDGHYIVERILENKPEVFRYQLYTFTNSAGRGIEQIIGEQRFIATDSGTRFEWDYNILPHNFFTRQIVKMQMDNIQAYISGGLDRLASAAKESAR